MPYSKQVKIVSRTILYCCTPPLIVVFFLRCEEYFPDGKIETIRRRRISTYKIYSAVRTYSRKGRKKFLPAQAKVVFDLSFIYVTLPSSSQIVKAAGKLSAQVVIFTLILEIEMYCSNEYTKCAKKWA